MFVKRSIFPPFTDPPDTKVTSMYVHKGYNLLFFLFKMSFWLSTTVVCYIEPTWKFNLIVAAYVSIDFRLLQQRKWEENIQKKDQDNMNVRYVSIVYIFIFTGFGLYIILFPFSNMSFKIVVIFLHMGLNNIISCT